jgi:hypothetical protein
MPEIIFSKGNLAKLEGLPGAAIYGEYEHKIKMYISEESNRWEKEKDIVQKLYNVEKSNGHSEAILGETNFGIFADVAESAEAPADTVIPGFDKNIIHHEFKKSFVITKTMIEDAKNGIAADARVRARNFARAYGMTRNKLAAAALANGTTGTMTFAGATYDIATADGLSLFNKAHKFPNSEDTQSNNFKATVDSTADLENALTAVSIKMRNFNDDNGEPLGYVPDIIILPGNRGTLETMVKKVVGTERTTGTNNNDIGLQYGNWDVVVLTDWVSETNQFIVMSSDANQALRGSNLFDRIPLTVKDDVDFLTDNYRWAGRARMGIGHYTWKHVARVTLEADDNATELTLN